MLSNLWHWVGWDGILAAMLWGSIVAAIVPATPLWANTELAYHFIEWAIAITMPLVVVVLTVAVGVLAYLYRELAAMRKDHSLLNTRVTTLEVKQISRDDFTELQLSVATLVAKQDEVVNRVDKFDDKLDRLLDER